MSDTDEEELACIRALLGNAPQPDAPDPPDVDPDLRDRDLIRSLFRTATTEENQ